VLAAIALTAACSKPATAVPPPEALPTQSQSQVQPQSQPRSGLTIDGEHFTRRLVIDHQQDNMPVAAFMAPEKWSDRSEVVWTYANVAAPVRTQLAVENPANAEALYTYPPVAMFWLRPSMGYYRPGQSDGGLTFGSPMDPAPTLLGFIRQTRRGFSDLKVVGWKDLPGLAAALNIPRAPNQHGVGIKVAYTLNGKPVEEEFYAVSYLTNIPYDGPQGRTWQDNWGLFFVHSFRAPAGTIDKRRPVFAAIARSLKNNPAWQQRYAAIDAYLTQQFNIQLQAGYDRIAAAGRLSAAISANNDAMIATIDSRLRSSGGGGVISGGRSPSASFDDYIRGVETTNDPYYGTSQHTNTEQYHWTDGYGSYRNTNDPSANPNNTDSGNWTLLQGVR
jgi:hypothetical protein